jgi:hypothetical protein
MSRYAPSAIEIAQDAMTYGGSLEGQGPLWFLPADESLALLQPRAVGERVEHWLKGMIAMTSRASLARMRIADAVAAAGYRLGEVPRRRIIVLVLGADEVSQPDASTLAPAQALDCLRQSGVPLVVWRVAMKGDPKDRKSNAAPKWPEWPEGDWVRGTRDFPRAIKHLREIIDRQRIVWIEDAVDLDAIEPRLPAGITVAGRSKPKSPPARLRPPSNGGPGPRSVYSVAFDPRSAAFMPVPPPAPFTARLAARAGTARRPEAPEASALAFSGGSPERLFAGASGALVSSSPSSPQWTSFDLPAVMGIATDPTHPAVLYAGGRGRIFRTADSGGNWSEISGDITSFVLDLAVDPKDPSTVYAGTAGSGVFKSRNQGQSWSPAGAELQNTAIRCFALDPNRRNDLRRHGRRRLR